MTHKAQEIARQLIGLVEKDLVSGILADELLKMAKELSKQSEDSKMLDWIIQNPYKTIDRLTHKCIRDDFRNSITKAMKGGD